jgi:parallel beta-helix repeat protein
VSGKVYVATDGNDAWSGLLASPNAAGTDGPKASLQAAATVMRNSATVKTASIEGGDYYLTSSLNLGPQDAGESWLPYAGQSVRIHGGQRVTGWSLNGYGNEKAAAPAGAFPSGGGVGDLFYDGVRQTHARYPNAVPANATTGGWLIAAASRSGQNTSNSFQFKPGDIPSFSSTSGMYVDVYQQNGWRNYILPVASINYATDTITLSGSTAFPIGQGSRYYIFNAQSQLGATGEWYYNSGSNMLNFKAPAGFDGNVTIGSLNNIFNIYNTSNITVAGLTLTDTLSTGSAINVSNSRGIDIAGNNITNAGIGVSFSSNSQYDTVEGNQISNIDGNGVQIPSGVDHISVLGNYIHDVGQLSVASGVWFSGSSDNSISYNLIENASKAGVTGTATSSNVGSYNNTISYNRIGNTDYGTSDGGAIYINGQYQQDNTNDLIEYNEIWGTTANGTVNNAGVPSTGFLPVTQLVSYGIYLDDFASGVTVTGNLLHDNYGGIHIHSGWNNTISGNFLVNNTGASLQNQVANPLPARQAESNNLFTGNLVSIGNGGVASVNLGTTANARWTDNFYDSTVIGAKSFAAFVLSTYTAASLTAWEALGYDAGASSGNPNFVNKSAGNYALAPGSPALAAGIVNLPTGKMGLAGFTGGNVYDSTWGQV